MLKTCANSWCQQSFEVTSDDLAFYEKVSPVFNGKKELIPPPTLCPECRMQRRYLHINFDHLYRRKSQKSGQMIISCISGDKSMNVYEPEKWWSDEWDGLTYGSPFDTTQNFFPQFSRLIHEVPVMSLFVDGCENSPYVQYCGWDKNCYLCFCMDYCEDCLYAHSAYYSKNLVDCFFCYSSELLYECIHCRDCYRVFYSQNCGNCNSSAFLYDCQHCQDCFGCVGLRNKQYCFFNVQMTKQDYDNAIAEFPLSHTSTISRVQSQWGPLLVKHARRSYVGLNNESVRGDYLFNCKNCYECFDCTDMQDVRYSCSLRGANDCLDISHFGHPAELCYECLAVGEGANHLLFSMCCWPNCSELLFCNLCMSCQHCFGCCGLKHKQYCIFNTQYSKEEYETIVPRIIDHMRRTGEWGEFFPRELSPFCYNETPIQHYLPLTKEQALAQGWTWKDPEDIVSPSEHMIRATDLPDALDTVGDDIVQYAIECSVTGRPFKIIKQELKFYREMNLALPRLHPDERLRRRIAKKNPRRLWSRSCVTCQKPISTSYSPERPEKVVCEECYLKEVY